MSCEIKYKTPTSALDYPFILEDWLDGDTIDTAVFTLETGLTLDSSSVNSGAVTIDGVSYSANSVAIPIISGGTVGEKYEASCLVTTDGPPVRTETFKVQFIIRE